MLWAAVRTDGVAGIFCGQSFPECFCPEYFVDSHFLNVFVQNISRTVIS